VRDSIRRGTDVTSNDSPLFSILLPTRGRPEGLRRLMDSFKATTACPDTVEVITVVDQDDTQTLQFEYNGFALKRVLVEPGLNMGMLNMAGYGAATGRYIMLLNDDVIVRTPRWDKKVLDAFKTYADEIVLVHVNDKIFEEKLCTFPFLPRKYCELAGGICPRDYIRYRIDDHIYNVFNLLAVMGKIRILYLPEVVFEHTNSVRTTFGTVEYRPDQRIHDIDTKRFNELLPKRKELALRLIEHIDSEADRDDLRIRKALLKPILDSVALRRPEYVRFWSDSQSLSSENARVTIGVVSADIRSDHGRTCLDLIKKFTKNFELTILDNHKRSSFNHPHEMNKVLSMCDTDYLVLMDDDVFVEPGWLDGMLRCITPSVGVVTPVHKDRSGNLSYAGVVMCPDYSGHHTHILKFPDRPTRIQTLCSAIMLIDMSKCGAIRFDESYSKYFLDIDYGLRIWSTGYEVVCSPYAAVTHLAGATLQQGSALSNDLFENQRQHFVREWIDSGRYRQVEQSIWTDIPEIQELLAIAPRIDSLINHPDADRELFRTRALDVFASIKNYPALRHWAAQRIREAAGSKRPEADDPKWGHLGFLLGCTPCPVAIEENFEGTNIFIYDASYFAIPRAEGFFDYHRLATGGYTRYYRAENLDILKARVRADARDVCAIQSRPGVPVLIEQTTGGMNIILFDGVYYAIPQGEGHFEYDRVIKRDYGKTYSSRNLDELKAQIGSRAGLLRSRKAARSIAKRIIKKILISLFGGKSFLRMRDVYLHERQAHHRLVAAWRSSKAALNPQVIYFLSGKMGMRRSAVKIVEDALTAGKIRQQAAERADPQRWLNASPAVLVDSDYRGYCIYNCEYKFFARPKGKESFEYQDIGTSGKYIIAHTMNEVRAMIDQSVDLQATPRALRRLVFACLPSSELMPLLKKITVPDTTTLLVGKSFNRENWENYPTIFVDDETLSDWARRQSLNRSDCESLQSLSKYGFDCVTIPWRFPITFQDNSLETTASKISTTLEVLSLSGEQRLYRGENLHRLVYNKAYLSSLFQVVPPPFGQSVLEAGCSDGLVCDIFAVLGAEKITGIDVMQTVGCSFPHDRIEYHVMDATRMELPDQSFDLVYSIATFEHLANPYKALLEMLRTTKIGGYGYVQAGPLYHSPFGHHMFAYFQDYPWIHLRKRPDEIIAYAKQRGIDKKIAQEMSLSCEQYVGGMLNTDHLNGLMIDDYRLGEFTARRDVEVVKFSISYEGRDLLSPVLAHELSSIDPERLVEHGFELAFRRLR